MKRKCLMAMIEKWRACADDGQIRGAILTDSFFVFDCIKLRNFVWFQLRISQVYSKQRTKINHG